MVVNPGEHWANSANFGGAAFITSVGNANVLLAAHQRDIWLRDTDRAAVLAWASWIDYWLNYHDPD